MRKLLLATASVALIGLSGAARADTVELKLADMETVTAGSYGDMPYFDFTFFKFGDVRLRKDIDVAARFHIDPQIKGNVADGEAAATAYGHNSYTETLSFADTVEGYMSRSGSHAISASSPKAHWGGYKRHKGYKY